jgi:hypothetical protein
MHGRPISRILCALALAVGAAALVAGVSAGPARAVSSEAASAQASEPSLSWVLSVPASTELFAARLALSASEVETVQAIGRRIDASQTAALLESDGRIGDASSGPQVLTAEASRFNSTVETMQEQGIRDIATRPRAPPGPRARSS